MAATVVVVVGIYSEFGVLHGVYVLKGVSKVTKPCFHVLNLHANDYTSGMHVMSYGVVGVNPP